MAGLDVAVVNDSKLSLADRDLDAKVTPLSAVDVFLPFGPRVVDAALLADLCHLSTKVVRAIAEALEGSPSMKLVQDPSSPSNPDQIVDQTCLALKESILTRRHMVNSLKPTYSGK